MEQIVTEQVISGSRRYLPAAVDANPLSDAWVRFYRAFDAAKDNLIDSADCYEILAEDIHDELAKAPEHLPDAYARKVERVRPLANVPVAVADHWMDQYLCLATGFLDGLVVTGKQVNRVDVESARQSMVGQLAPFADTDEFMEYAGPARYRLGVEPNAKWQRNLESLASERQYHGG